MTRNGRNRTGFALSEAMEKQGVGPIELAKRLGCTRQYVDELRNGRQWPNLWTVHRIAGVLGVPPSSLIDDTVPAEGRRKKIE